MIKTVLIFLYWFYNEEVKDIIKGWKNFLIFSTEYFSIPLLLKTLFSPWKRDITKKPRGLDLKKIFEYIMYNLISRGTGFIIRFFTIIVGIFFFILTIIAGAIILILWLFLPLIILVLIALFLILIL
ncbi:MAG: hypothetical protein GF387_00570 [Candidatus Portnoybacteria bacterium]|nr:hypothetical protein [Candidatus Portnoybacteria bacterium]